MNTLSTNLIKELLKKYSTFANTTAAICSSETTFPVDVIGIKGSLHSFFIESYMQNAYKKWLSSFQYTSQGYFTQEIKKNSFTKQEASVTLIIVPTEKDALSLKSDLEVVFPEAKSYVLPSWQTLYYRPTSSFSITFGKRSGILSRLAIMNSEEDVSNKIDFSPKIFIASLKAVLSPLPPPDFILKNVFVLKKGQNIDMAKIAENLSRIGYSRVPKVSVRGEFSLRGEVLDIFLPEEENPYRIQFDFDTIEKIRTFDAESQTTITQVEKILIYPMKEVIWNDELLENLKKLLDEEEKRLEFTEDAKKAKEKLIFELETKGFSEGEELFYSALWEEKHSILDYISENTAVFMFDFERLENSMEVTERERIGMYKTTRQTFPVLLPSKIFFKFDEILEKVSRCIKLHTISSEKSDNLTKNLFKINCDPNMSYFGNINYLKEDFKNLLANDWNIFIFADNQNQGLRISEILKSFSQENDFSTPLQIIALPISEGFIIPELKLRVIQENEIFGRKKYNPVSLKKAKSEAIDTFIDLESGDYIVHVNYGIGIFRGIDRVKAMGNERDYIKLEYADEEFVFVPIEQVNLVQRYIGSEGDGVKLDRIGSKSWDARKAKVRAAVEDLAHKLIDLYSRRKAAHGFPFPKDTEWQTTFEAAFPYEDTPDQITVTKEVKDDMEKALPMDRLVCGDVGYGKTEIAMRAAFKAVMGGKQVAFLAPTTILAEQHYETCMERFKNFPVKIAQLSRFISSAQQKKIIAQLKKGEIDILIGTHRIIQKDVQFKNLGLMIIDEEQRFGVKDKEKLKSMKNNIDCLALSATPIPRTLHMSLLKIRDMSLLTTPPQSRQAIQTVIDEYSDERVVDAVRKEVERGGQVFYLHNRVESLMETRLKLERILPEMMIDVAHGQMSSDELDDIFKRFKMGGFHILVATTIIENGIDIPNVNTIIIDRADMYGISQLYQLRGRVGRSDRQAYAYMLYPGNRSLSEIAMKRLQVISDFTELGSGFKIAMKDMEIRGAGNLLGRDQSGNVYSVGFDMYVRLLNQAVERLTSQNDYEEQTEVLLELEYSGFIPDSYVQNLQTKMEIYKKIASVQEKDSLDSIYLELEDRFGPVPDEVLSLLSLSEIKIISKKLSISSIKEHAGIARIEFLKVKNINVEKILNLIKESAGAVKLDPTKPNMIFLSTGKIGLKEKSEFIKEKLEKLI